MLDDMTTDGNLSFNVSGAAFCGAGAPTTCTIPVTGKYWVKDFQFPSMLGLGLSFAPNDKLMLAADYKRIGWKSAMENFNITFIASAGQANAGAAGFANTQLDVVYYQRWKDQDVLALGASYKISDPLTVRAGLNISNNPVPDAYVSPLFPAIVTNHVTLGAGYKVSQAGDIDFALSHAPKVSVTNNWGTIGASSNQTISHSQTSWQLMYSHKF
jgi:long-chain fatty acid transport protein